MTPEDGTGFVVVVLFVFAQGNYWGVKEVVKIRLVEVMSR